mgnify:CR=1 FL=1
MNKPLPQYYPLVIYFVWFQRNRHLKCWIQYSLVRVSEHLTYTTQSLDCVPTRRTPIGIYLIYLFYLCSYHCQLNSVVHQSHPCRVALIYASLLETRPRITVLHNNVHMIHTSRNEIQTPSYSREVLVDGYMWVKGCRGVDGWMLLLLIALSLGGDAHIRRLVGDVLARVCGRS